MLVRKSTSRRGTCPPKDGTYFFWPRLRCIKGTADGAYYIDRIVVRGQYMSIYTTNRPQGRNQAYAGDFVIQGHVRDFEQIILQDLDNPRRSWVPISSDYDEANGGGSFAVFQGVTATRFSLTQTKYGEPYDVFEEIVLGEPDE